MGTRLRRRKPTRLEKIAEAKKMPKKLINKKEDDDGGSNTGHTKRA